MKFFDMDGVFVDHVAGACEWAGKTVQELITPGQWEIPGIVWHNLPEAFWASLPRMPDFDTIYEKVMEEWSRGGECFLLTSACSDECYAGKMSWVTTHLPAFTCRVIFTQHKHLLAAPDRVLYDDRDLFIDNWNAAGGTGILIPRLWNSGHTRLKHFP